MRGKLLYIWLDLNVRFRINDFDDKYFTITYI